MITELRNLSAFAAGSKLFGKALKGWDAQVESDIGRLKKGVRSNCDLNWHEAWYRTLDKVGLVDVLVSKLNGEMGLTMSGDLAANLKHAEETARHCHAMYRAYPEKVHFRDNAEYYDVLADGYRVIVPHQQEAALTYNALPRNRSGNVDWKDIDSIQFYVYDPVSNQFVKFDHKAKK